MDNLKGSFFNRTGSITAGLMHTVKEIKRSCKAKVKVEPLFMDVNDKILKRSKTRPGPSSLDSLHSQGRLLNISNKHKEQQNYY